MITTFRTLTAAGAAALALAGGAALTGSTAQADNGDAQRMPERPAARALVSSCTGGHTVSMSRKATDFQNVAAGTTADIEGSLWNVKGPKKGSDTILVTLYSLASSGGAGELTSVSLYKDGVGTSEGTKYFTYNGVLDQAAVQFCAKISHGAHTFTLKAIDGGGGATTMYYPTITYERFS
jgi:hypothetical protein